MVDCSNSSRSSRSRYSTPAIPTTSKPINGPSSRQSSNSAHACNAPLLSGREGLEHQGIVSDGDVRLVRVLKGPIIPSETPTARYLGAGIEEQLSYSPCR